jgi:large conductance mechanosensitive channel protein
MDNIKSQKPRRSVATKARAKSKAEFSGFVEFLRTQGVVGLAIGFIIGTQAKVLVDTLNASFINPLLGLMLGSGNKLSAQTFTLSIGSKHPVFAWGQFVFVLINFIITAVIIYIAYRWLRLDKLEKEKKK